MKAVLRTLALPPVSVLLSVIILSLAVLGLGTYALPWLGGRTGWIIIGILVLGWTAFTAFWLWRRRRRNAQMLAEMAEAADDTDRLIDAEGAELEDKFSAALRDLSKLRLKNPAGGSRYLYELPWYIFVGPPAAGKTEALKNCGLKFLWQGEEGEIDLEGGAGTRNCHWVFTDDAVFIDTAGRYTTRSSDEAVDAAAWTKFLDLLRRHRPREPINGAIVAISLSELAAAAPEDVAERAGAIRARLRELCERMGARIPVYVLFTKADLLVGFNEFFGQMGSEERKQVWGTTFPLADGGDAEKTLRADLASVPEEFDRLVGRLGEIQFDRLREEADLDVRSRIFGFPAQFASMKPVIADFLKAAFEPDRLTEPMTLRGFYFTSATQVGQPVDRLVASLNRDYGIDRQAVAMVPAGSGRAYFLSDLLSRVVFPEAGLVSQGTRRGIPWGRYAGIAACVALPLAFGGALYAMHTHNRAQADGLRDTLDAYADRVGDIETAEIDSGDPTPVLPALNLLRAERDRLAAAEPPVPGGLGLDVSDELARRAQEAYDHGLEKLLRPRLLHRMQTQVSASRDTGAELYDRLKVYIILAGGDGSQIEGNRSLIQRELAVAIAPDLQGGGSEADAAALFGGDGQTGHIENWLAKGRLDPWIVDGEPNYDTNLIVNARDRLDAKPEDRALQELEAGAAKVLPSWSVRRAAGSSLDTSLVSLTGDPIETVIPALYTRRGFREFFIPFAARTVDALRGESWVTSDPEDAKRNEAQIIRDLENKYYREYIAYWRGVLEDMRVRPFADPSGGTAVLGSLAAPNRSPLLNVLTEVAFETRLDEPLEGEEADAVGNAAQSEAMKIINRELAAKGAAGRIVRAGIGSGGGGAEDAVPPGEPVAKAFEELHAFVEDGGLGELERALGEFRDVVATSALDGPEEARAALRKAVGIRALAAQNAAPEPLGGFLRSMLAQADETSAADTRTRLGALWTSNVHALCARKIHGKYPFGTGAPASLGDVAQVLHPDGEIARFFDRYLAVHIDRSTWTLRPSGAALGLSGESLSFFREAALIRDALFADGLARPAFEMTVKAVSREREVESILFRLGGQEARFSATENRAISMQWPGNQPAGGVEIEVALPPDALVEAQGRPLRKGGTWGLFRMVDELGWKAAEGGRKGRMRGVANGQVVRVELGFPTPDNALNLRGRIRAFRCPERLE